MLRTSVFLLLLFRFSSAWAYPDFIGLGYKTCVLCHYNSQGNGPLTDYGRALFSQEIAARNFWTPRANDEEVAEKYSGFIPGVTLPYWIRPAIKYRGLYLNTNPGSSISKPKWIHMQRDLDVVFAFDKDSRTVLVLNYGLLDRERDYYGDGKMTETVTREHYLRFYPTEKLLVAIGLMDKVYGLRTADHTSVARSGIGLGQDDQAHALQLQWFEEEWDVSVQGWIGNMFRPTKDRKKGGSIEFETSLGENDRIGASFLTESDEDDKALRFGVHNRWGIPKFKSSVMVEAGVAQNQTQGSDTKTGTYALIQSLINLTRGYNFLTSVERGQAESRFSSPEMQRWTFGFMMFPIQKTEVRLTAVQAKIFSPETAFKDSWSWQGQLHVSF